MARTECAPPGYPWAEARRSAGIDIRRPDRLLDEVEQDTLAQWLAYPYPDRRLPSHLLPKGLAPATDEELESEYPPRFSAMYDGELSYADCRLQRAALESGQTEFTNRHGRRRTISVKRIATWLHAHSHDSPYVDRFRALLTADQQATWNLAPEVDDEVFEDTEDEGYD